MKKDTSYRDQLLELSKLYKIPEVKSIFKSRDYVGEDNVTNFPKEFLNKLDFNNIPPHEL